MQYELDIITPFCLRGKLSSVHATFPNMGPGPKVNPYTRLVLRKKNLLSGLFFYRVTHLLSDLGWVDLDFGCSTCLGSTAAAVQPKPKSTQPRSARRWITL